MAYAPSAANAAKLGNIVSLVAAGKLLTDSFKKAPAIIATLPGGQLYFDSALELDTDGWPDGAGKGDPHYQPHTSYRLADGSSLDSNAVPFFVLPQPVSWPKQFGIWLGDIAAILRKGRLAFAIFGDFGNPHRIGEASVALFRELGLERIKDGQIINAGTEPGVVTIVFPGSRPALKPASTQSLVNLIRQRGQELYSDLLNSPQPAVACSGRASGNAGP